MIPALIQLGDLMNQITQLDKRWDQLENDYVKLLDVVKDPLRSDYDTWFETIEVLRLEKEDLFLLELKNKKTSGNLFKYL